MSFMPRRRVIIDRRDEGTLAEDLAGTSEKTGAVKETSAKTETTKKAKTVAKNKTIR